MTKKIKVSSMFRSMNFERSAIDVENRTVELIFSSEAGVERWDGIEILDHSPGAVDLSRLNSGGALLKDHDTRIQTGVIVSAAIGADRVGRATVRFGRSPAAEAEFQDVCDGIRTLFSVGYRINKVQLEKTEGNLDTYRVTSWMPYEISTVAVPADMNCKVGREEEISVTELEVREEPKTEVVAAVETAIVVEPAATPKIVNNGDRKMEKTVEEIRKEEQKRAAEITALGRKFSATDLADRAIAEGISVDSFRATVMDNMPGATKVVTASDIGLTAKEVRRFSFVNAIRAATDGNWSNAGFEQECSRAVEKQMGKSSRGFFVPNDVLTRGMNVGTAADGGNLVSTDLHSASFIEMLRNKMVIRAMGATVLGGLVGDVAIPKQTGGATAYWVSEDSAANASKQAIGQIGLTPKSIAAFTEISRKLMNQSSLDVEAMVRNDLAASLALGIDAAAIFGGGAGEPSGILALLQAAQLVTVGANGGAATFAKMVEMETKVATANADVGGLGYLTNAKVRGALKTTEKAANSAQFVWTDAAAGVGQVNGYKAMVSNQVPSNLSKGTGTNLSAAIFGNFSDVVIGEWSGLDVMVNPYTLDTIGAVRVTAFQDVDVALRRLDSFSAFKEIIA